LLKELGFGAATPTVIYSNNRGAIKMGLHPSNKPATRHIDMRRHFLREYVELKHVTTPSRQNRFDGRRLHDEADSESNAHAAFHDNFRKSEFQVALEANRHIG
jgi:hypothetical protein